MRIFDKIFGKRPSSKSEKAAEPSPDIVIEGSVEILRELQVRPVV